MLFLQHGFYPEAAILGNRLNDLLERLAIKPFAGKNLPNLFRLAGRNQRNMGVLHLFKMIIVVHVGLDGLIVANRHAKAVGDKVCDTQDQQPELATLIFAHEIRQRFVHSSQ